MGTLKVKTYFDISPQDNGRCVFKEVGFNINDIRLITEPTMAGSVIDYRFYIYTGYTDEFKLEFRFARLKDAKAAKEELARAWTETGEFSNEYVEGVVS